MVSQVWIVTVVAVAVAVALGAAAGGRVVSVLVLRKAFAVLCCCLGGLDHTPLPELVCDALGMLPVVV